MNKFDDVKLDIPRLLREHPPARYSATAHTGQHLSLAKHASSILARYFTAVVYKTGLHRRLVYANLKLDWFFEFRHYWMKVLELRRLELHDFYFLSGLYRQKFQALAIPDHASPAEFLAAWQSPATLYLLFHYQYKLALHPLSAYTLAKYIHPGSHVLEYGCGLAPITQSLIKYYPGKNLNFTVADIPTVLLHFVQWKFRTARCVRILPLDPGNLTPLDAAYDVITCLTVLEHLPNALPIVKHLHHHLKPDGYFVFDYIRSEGKGLDTGSSLRDRDAVLNFIRQNFNVIRGTIPSDGRNVKTVICQKK